MVFSDDGERCRGVGYVIWIPRSNVELEDSRLVVLYGGKFDGLFTVGIDSVAMGRACDQFTFGENSEHRSTLM